MKSAPRLAKDNITVGATWGQVFELWDIWSLYVYIVGGDVKIRWASAGQHEPDWSEIDQNGEIIVAPGGTFDQLDNDHARWQFQLSNPAASAVVSFKAQRRPSGLIVAGA